MEDSKITVGFVDKNSNIGFSKFEMKIGDLSLVKLEEEYKKIADVCGKKKGFAVEYKGYRVCDNTVLNKIKEDAVNETIREVDFSFVCEEKWTQEDEIKLAYEKRQRNMSETGKIEGEPQKKKQKL